MQYDRNRCHAGPQLADAPQRLHRWVVQPPLPHDREACEAPVIGLRRRKERYGHRRSERAALYSRGLTRAPAAPSSAEPSPPRQRCLLCPMPCSASLLSTRVGSRCPASVLHGTVWRCSTSWPLLSPRAIVCFRNPVKRQRVSAGGSGVMTGAYPKPLCSARTAHGSWRSATFQRSQRAG